MNGAIKIIQHMNHEQWMRNGCPIRPYYNANERFNIKHGTLAGQLMLFKLERLKLGRIIEKTLKQYYNYYIKS